ncbi:MAG: glutamate racemase [Moraxellaceae bacterium]|nr:MAG: glutamate racemase [Moraxellaceae bacterium]
MNPADITAQSNTPNILIFDSGIGGLTIAAEITKILPQHPIIYIADNRLYPYGTKPDAVLRTRARSLFPILEAHYHPSIIVIACNSASTLILDEVRALTDTPVIGVVPAIKPAAEFSKTGSIGLLATKVTINRPYTQNLINQFAGDHNVVSVGSDILVFQAEQKMHGNPIDTDAIRQELLPFINQPNIDTIVLGCTHFPLLRDEISHILGQSVELIDSINAIARRTAVTLSKLTPDLPSTLPTPKHRFIFTAPNPKIDEITPTLHRRGFSDILIGNH